MKQLALLLCCALLASLWGCSSSTSFLYANRDISLDPDDGVFLPGAQWRDMDGELIQAHGGQVQRMPVPDGSGGQQQEVLKAC